MLKKFNLETVESSTVRNRGQVKFHVPEPMFICIDCKS